MFNPLSPGASPRCKAGKMSREKVTACSKTTQAVISFNQSHWQEILQKSSQQYMAFSNQPFSKTLTSSSTTPTPTMIRSLVNFNPQYYRINRSSFLYIHGCSSSTLYLPTCYSIQRAAAHSSNRPSLTYTPLCINCSPQYTYKTPGNI